MEPIKTIEGDDDEYEVTYTVNGQFHREDGPAATWYVSGTLALERWYRHGKLHRKDGPAMICYAKGKLCRERWYQYGQLHRDDGPACVEYNGHAIEFMEWYQNDKKHREDGPAEIQFHCRKKIMERWFRDDNLHREDGPATELYDDGNIVGRFWYRNDELCGIGTLAAAQIYKENEWHTYMILSSASEWKSIDELRDMLKGDAIHDALRALPIPIRQEIAWYYCYQ